jgi:hypothetical protein
MSSIEEVAQAIQEVLGPVADVLGRESGFIQRERAMSGSQFAQMVVFGWWSNPQATLEELAQSGASVGVTISGQGLDQRFTASSAEFMRQVLSVAVQQMIQADRGVAGLLERFSAVYVHDSTIIGLPDRLKDVWAGCGGRVQTNTQAALKIQVQQDLRRGAIHQLWLQAGREHDLHTKIPVEAFAPGSLRLADVGFFDLDYFAQLGQRGCYWLSRLKAGTCLRDATGRTYKVETLLRTTSQDCFEQSVLLGKANRLPARLVAVRLPPQLATRRRQQLLQDAQREGQSVSSARLLLAGWLVYVTNVPPEVLTLHELLRLGRIRWQIELLFKLWKSEGRLDESRSTNPWRILCEVYAKLLALLIQHWVLLIACWHFPDRSLTKAIHTVRRFAMAVAIAWSSRPALISVLAAICRCLSHGCRIFKSKKKPSTFQRLFGEGLT